MYKILLFDDRPQVRISLEESFKSRGMDVFACKSIYEANDKWDDHRDELDAIVIDMMIPSSGLNEPLRQKTGGGLLSGWVWLWHALNPKNEHPHPAADKCIVIYSAYLDDFDKYIKSNKPSEEEKKFADCVKLIPKDNSNKENEVVTHLIDDCGKRGKL